MGEKVAGDPTEDGMFRVRHGLSTQLLVTTAALIIVAGLLSFIPIITGYRLTWLRDRMATADAASVVLSASEWTDVPRAVQDDLLRSAGVMAIAVRSGQVSRLLAAVEMPPAVDEIVDLRTVSYLTAARQTLGSLMFGPKIVRVVSDNGRGATIEIVMNDSKVRAGLLRTAVTLFGVLLVISVVVGALGFLRLQFVLVRPIRRISKAMIDFADAPEDASRTITPSERSDEIGLAERHLARMQTELRHTLQQQRRLADLGLAVSKINHDLRNMLSAAQLISDRLGTVPDPTVQSIAPKLIAAIDRAILYCQSTLTYGRPREAPPDRRLLLLSRLVDDVAEVLGLEAHSTIRFTNEVPAILQIDADPDQLFRVLVNICRNALQALEGDKTPAVVREIVVTAAREGSVVRLRVRDTGPGIPPQVKANLFRAFQGSSRPGGTGLGLAIAAELVKAHGGSIALASEGPGTTFEIVIADRPIEFARAERARA